MSILQRSRSRVHSNPIDVEAALAEAWRLDADDVADFHEEDLLPADEVLDLAGWLERESAAMALRDDPTARWLSRKLNELAGEARFLGAATGLDFDARRDQNHVELMQLRFDMGYQHGQSDFECPTCNYQR